MPAIKLGVLVFIYKNNEIKEKKRTSRKFITHSLDSHE